MHPLGSFSHLLVIQEIIVNRISLFSTRKSLFYVKVKQIFINC